MWKLLIIYPKPKQRNLKVWINFPHVISHHLICPRTIQAITILFLYIATNIANTPYHLTLEMKPKISHNFMTKYWEPGRIVPWLQSVSPMKPLFYSIRNNWCQIWWFETPLRKAIFYYDNDDDDVAYWLDLSQRKRKPKGEGKDHLVDSVLLEAYLSHNPLKTKAIFFSSLSLFFLSQSSLRPPPLGSVALNLTIHKDKKIKHNNTITQPHSSSTSISPFDVSLIKPLFFFFLILMNGARNDPPTHMALLVPNH